ncbi:ribosomal protein S18 acetylase RimI-like enzyme [Paenibacillus endophyticus]|uniref:Ribosomal protein S18 acetylase RimI-like enzyme n=1 Tax=Paenibacillus endophyticus TaxID=1294268 RepID=A0A7W5C5H3_9BACL|nr:ribosomal protein S18 acetylase RimI-like enzyme [Paenibacillus endophyticus]
MDIEISRATIKDVEQLATLFNEYRIFYKQLSDVLRAQQFLADRIQLEQSIIFKAIKPESSKMIAFTQLYPIFSSVSMKKAFILNDLYVIESDRGQGVAELLLDRAKTYALENGAKGLELSTACDNAIAQRLYERNGYEKDETYFHYYLTL